jgi:hypothetical protein
VFASSRRDQVAPLPDISPYLEPMLRAGADVSVHERLAVSHRTTVIAGLWRAPQLVRMVRAARPPEPADTRAARDGVYQRRPPRKRGDPVQS